MSIKKKLYVGFALAVILALGFTLKPKLTYAAPATFTVNSTADTGDANGGDGICETSTPGECTLRAAIEQANSNGNPSDQDVIAFSIAGTGLHTIHQTGVYYFIDQAVKIDGLTQPGSSGNTAAWPAPLNGTLNIQIDSSSAQTNGLAAFLVGSDNVSINGLVVGGSPSGEFIVDGGALGTNFTGNYIGLDSSGLVADYSAATAILGYGANNITIGGSSPSERNVIVGNEKLVALYEGSDNTTIRGNYFGVAADGVTGMLSTPGMNTASVEINGDNAKIGGTIAGQGNTFSGNQGEVSLSISATNSSVLGNFISGSFAGLNIGDSSNLNIGDGTSAGRNVVSGNDLPNGFGGSGGYGSGILVNSSTGPVSIKGNYVGVSEDGSTPFGNGARGITVQSNTQNVIIGGTSPGEENVIANNGLDGVRVSDSAHAAILGNSIYNNGGLGINLVGADDEPDVPTPTPNDSLDTDTGPNDLLNKPTLLPPVVSGSDTDVSYRLDVPAGDYRVEFFANTAYDPSGSGEGETYLTSDTVTSLGAGPQLFNLTIPGNTHANISATVTKIDVSSDSGYSITSEFSAIPSTDIDTAVTKTVVDQNTIPRDGTIQYQVTFTNNGMDSLDLSQYVVDSGDPLNTALFNDIFPANLTLDSVTGDADCSTQNAASTFGTLFSAHSSYNVASCSFTGDSSASLGTGESLSFTLSFSLTNPTLTVFSNYLLAIPLSSDSSYADYQNAISDNDDLVSTLGGSDNLATATTTQQQTDIGLVKTLTNPQDFGPNSHLNYSFTYTNHGPSPLVVSRFNSIFSAPLIMDYLVPDLTPSNLGATGPISGSYYLTGLGNTNITCLWAGPGSLGTSFGVTTHADYSFILCQYNTPNIVMEAGQNFNFNISFTTGSTVDPNLRNYALAFSPSSGSVDPGFPGVDITNNETLDDLIANSTSNNPFNNFSVASLSTDIGITASLVNPQDVSPGNTIFYDVTLHNKGPASLNLSNFSTFDRVLFTGVFPAQDLDFVSATTSDITCVDVGPGSVAYLGAADSSHTTHQLLVCLYTGSGGTVAPGSSYTIRLQFTAKSPVSDSFNAYFLTGRGFGDPDEALFNSVFFGASSDILDTFTNDNFARVTFGDTPPPDIGGGGGPTSNPTTNSNSNSITGLSGTGQNIIMLAGAGLILIVTSAGLVFYRKRFQK